jgi:hypothetical protein
LKTGLSFDTCVIDITDVFSKAKWAAPFRRHCVADMQANSAERDFQLVSCGQHCIISTTAGNPDARSFRKDYKGCR